MNKYNGSRCIAAAICSLQNIKIWGFIWVLLLTIVYADATIRCEAIGNVQWTWLCGKISNTFSNRKMETYLGIPYALPPVNDLRFKNPQPYIDVSEGLIDAKTEKPQCLHAESAQSTNEDCLYLNVYVPGYFNKIGRNTSLNLPVLVLIHGGSYMEGNGNSKLYRPEYLVEQSIVLVTVNYRLNTLGFFSTENEASPGNYGLKDIAMALKWIQQNIVYLDGDPRSVTLMGSSTGSEMVHLLALSQKTEGLFHKYILISGSALSPWNMRLYDREQYRRTGLKLAQSVGCLPEGNPLRQLIQKPENKSRPIDDIYNGFVNSNSNSNINETTYLDYYKEMMNCMRTVDAKTLIRYNKDIDFFHHSPQHVFGPTIEAESADAILTMHPVKILREGLLRDIPVLMMTMKDEGLSLTLDFVLYDKYYGSDRKNFLLLNYEKNFPHFLEYKLMVNDTEKFASAINNFYFDRNVNLNVMQNITHMVGDGAITWPMFKALQCQSKFGNSNIYFLNFAYEGTFTSFTINCAGRKLGNCHVDNMEKKFGKLEYSPLIYRLTEENERTMINVTTELLTTFLRSDSGPQMPTWPNYRDTSRFVRIGNGQSMYITVEPDFLVDRMEFWDDLMPTVLDEQNAHIYRMLLSQRPK